MRDLSLQFCRAAALVEKLPYTKLNSSIPALYCPLFSSCATQVILEVEVLLGLV